MFLVWFGTFLLTISAWTGAATQNQLITTKPVESRGLTAISAGALHSCAVTDTGEAKCWGDNGAGQLGDGTVVEKLTPVGVAGLASGVSAIASGKDHSCALTAGGSVKCWGANFEGQLGDGTFTDRLAPVDVDGLTSGVSAIVTGDFHSCALTTGGGVKCWGTNLSGELGNGANDASNSPVDVVGLSSGAVAIAAGSGHTCALTASGIKCWGWNGDGQLGDGTTMDRNAPVNVVGFSSAAAYIDAGFAHSCAVTNSGGLKCWGWNGSGQVGDGTTMPRLTPVNVMGLTSGVFAVAAGRNHSCALTTSGGTKCWGGNITGQLGDGTTTPRLAPADVTGLTSGVAEITAGEDHSCAATSNGGLKCWGWNEFGQLGDGTKINRTTCVSVPIQPYLLYLPLVLR